jgi:hypothetical protein
MKRNLLLLAVMVVTALLFSTTWAQDLGRPDSLVIKTFDCDHTYEATAGYDSVRVCLWVSHDSNTFFWQAANKWVQDSISAMVIPLTFWHQPAGTADSVILPNWDVGTGVLYNNTEVAIDDPNPLPYSVFRDIFCEGTTYTNRMRATLKWDTRVLDIESHSCTGDSGHAYFSLIAGGSRKKWFEGSNVLLASLTFWVYMNPSADTTEIGIDSISAPPAWDLSFVRYDAAGYVPITNLYVKDTIYIVPCLPPQITCPANESKPCNGTYTTTTKFNATAGGTAGILLTGVTAATAAPGLSPTVTVNYDSPPPAAALSGTITYTVTNHCLAGGAITLTATNNCEPPQTALCSFNVTFPTNLPPDIVCPLDVSGPYHILLVSGDYTATDECAPPTVTMSYIGTPDPPAHIPVLVGKHVEWQAYCTDCITVTLTATDDNQATDQCTFTMCGTNQAPSCDVNLPPSASATFTVPGTFSSSDPNGDGTVNPVTAADFTTTLGGIVSNVGAGTFDYTAPAVAGIDIVCLTVTDECGLESECCDTIIITTEPFNQVKIPNKVYERFGFGHWDYMYPQDPEAGDNCIMFDEACEGWWGINPGDFFEIPIILRNFDAALTLGGFELEVDFDYIDLTFYGAERGGLLEKRLIGPNPIPWQDDIFWSWEYFSYRVLPCPTCACCKYKILLYGQAEMPDGDFRRGYCLTSDYLSNPTDSTWWYEDEIMDVCPDGQVIDAFATLAWLKFQVANNELLRDLKLPIVFEWEHKFCENPPNHYYICQDWDCAENTFSNCDGSILYVSGDTMQYSSVCPATEYADLLFIDGGVHICSPCTAFTCVRGDINMDDVTYSTADAVMFANYFVHGLGVFTINRDVQVCATDINADGRTLMLSDLIYLIRVIQRDAVPFPKLGPSSDVANVIVSDGRITVECASAIGGILFKFDGNVTPTLLNANMELLSNEGNVLVWSSAGNSINAGASQLLTVSGELVSVMAVDREGRDLATIITTKVAPTTFALNPAYPNPFNPNTNLSFSLPTAVSYSLNIYNVAGQLVRSYEGMGNVGLNVIMWDGKDNAGSDVSSGVYFYKLIAGGYTATNKMVMMK